VGPAKGVLVSPTGALELRTVMSGGRYFVQIAPVMTVREIEIKADTELGDLDL
jgi:hypothetical protein